MNANHLIERMVFSFGLEDESLYPVFADRISEMSNDGLSDAIERVLDSYSTDDVHISIDRLEIDVGDVRMEDLREVVKARVVQELTERLESMRKVGVDKGLTTEDTHARRERMLESFILHGRLPWWAPTTGVRMKEVFRSVMAEPTEQARRLFEKARHNNVLLKRLLGLAEVDALAQSWKRKGDADASDMPSDLPSFIHEAVRMVAPRFGREKAYEIVKYNLLAEIMGRTPVKESERATPPLAVRLFRESPVSGLSDANRRFIEYTLRPLVRRTSRTGAADVDMEDDSAVSSKEPGMEGRLSRRERKKAGKGRSRPRSAARKADGSDPLLSDLRSFLVSGRLEVFRHRNTGAEVNVIFRRLVQERLAALTDLVVSMGRSLRVRQRLLDNVSSRNIRRFFTEVMPGRKDLLTWLDSVYLETQEKVRPINQTNIRVQKSVDEVTLEILTTTDINAISNEAFLRMHLKRMALKHNIRYRDLLRAIVEATGLLKRLASNRFFEILMRLHGEVFPERREGRSAEVKDAKVAEAGAADAARTDDHAGTGGQAPATGKSKKGRYFLRYEAKSRKFRPWVEDASLESLIPPSGQTETGAAGQGPKAAPSEKEAQRSDLSSSPDETGRPASDAGPAISEERGLSRTEAFRERDGDIEEPFSDLRERRQPLPNDLLYRLPKELVRRLIAVKRTPLLGRNTKALQDLISGYLRFVANPMPYDEAAIPGLIERIAAHLDVDPGFLRFALDRVGAYQGIDTPTRSAIAPSTEESAADVGGRVSIRDGEVAAAGVDLAEGAEAKSEEGLGSVRDGEVAAAGVDLAEGAEAKSEEGLGSVRDGEVAAAGGGFADAVDAESGIRGTVADERASESIPDADELIRHLTEHRHHYSAYHVRSLLRRAIGRQPMRQDRFAAIATLLFDRDAKLVVQTVDGILASSHRVVDAAMRSEVYRAFVESALDPRNTPFDMNVLLKEVRRRVGVDRKEPFVTPARLSEAEMYFSPVRREETRRRGKGAARRMREKNIILFYNILNLDIALEEAGVSFFDNILFSFELLLTRYRPRFLEILRANAYNTELARFFAYTDDSRLFEQIMRLLPRSRTERVTQSFAAVTDIVHRLGWLDLPREEVRRFAYMDAYALMFSEGERPPMVSELLVGVLQRAARAQLLAADSVSDVSLPVTPAEMRRIIGSIRYRQLFDRQGVSEEQGLRGLLEQVRLVRDDVSQPGPQNEALRTSRLVEAVMEDGRFPEDHPFAGAAPEAHVAYMKELVGEGEVLARLVGKGSKPAVVSGMAEWLDRPQLIAALAHRYSLPLERLSPVLRGWLDLISVRPVEERELLTRLLLAPVPVTPSDRLTVFNRAFLLSAMRDRHLSVGDGFEVLFGDAAVPPAMRVGLAARHVVDAMPAGSERWPEFYLGVLSSPSIGNPMAYRVMDAWVRYFTAHPGGMTSEGVFRKLTGVYFGNAFWHQRSQRRMHQLILEGTRVLHGVGGPAARSRVLDLMAAGVPADLLLEHAAVHRPDILSEVEDAMRSRGAEPARVAASMKVRMSSVLGPAELARYLLGAEDRTGKTPRVLRRWMDEKPWNEGNARRFLRQLPDKAAERLLRLLSGPVDLERIALRWTAFLKTSGLVRDAAEATGMVYAAILAGRLWTYASREYIHADIFRRLDIAGRLRRSRKSVIVDTIRASALPPTLFRSALADEPAEGWADTDSIMQSWMSAAAMPGEAAPVRMDDPLRSVVLKGFGRVDADVLLFLETGRVAGQSVPAIASPEFRSIIERVRSADISLFLDLPTLHPAALSMLQAFFSRSEVVEHLFQGMYGKTRDRALEALLRETASRLARTPMPTEALIRLVRLYRRRFRGGTVPTASDVEGFLSEALRIRGFEAVAASAAAGLKVTPTPARRSTFLRRLLERTMPGRTSVTADFGRTLAHYLDRGRMPDAQTGDVPEEFRRLVVSRMASGDAALRTLLHTRVATASSRQRLLRLLGPGAEKRLMDFLHPQLRSALVVFAVMMKRHFGIDAWKAVGGGGVSAKLELVLQWWADARPRLTDPIEVVRLFMEQLADALDRDDMDRLVKADVSRFTAAEKAMWMQLKALVPGMVDLPPDRERRIPTKEEAEKQAQRSEPDTDLDPGEGITVQNGGLVLLWPFLGRLFSRLQLTDGKAFVGEREQARAIQLTEYLVNGRTETEEYELSLNKVLCGAELEFPVPPVLDITPEEEDLCQKMLVGVIRNWEKMKNTRPKTFQETFLRREARLYRLEDRWELSVGRKAYDVLLDTLPWNISMFQLNWMPQRMVVHWK